MQQSSNLRGCPRRTPSPDPQNACAPELPASRQPGGARPVVRAALSSHRAASIRKAESRAEQTDQHPARLAPRRARAAHGTTAVATFRLLTCRVVDPVELPHLRVRVEDPARIRDVAVVELGPEHLTRVATTHVLRRLRPVVDVRVPDVTVRRLVTQPEHRAAAVLLTT